MCFRSPRLCLLPALACRLTVSGGGDVAIGYLTTGYGGTGSSTSNSTSSNSSSSEATGAVAPADAWRGVQQARVVWLSFGADGNPGRSARALMDSAVVPHRVWRLWRQQQQQQQEQQQGDEGTAGESTAAAASAWQDDAPSPVWPLCADDMAYGGCGSLADAAQVGGGGSVRGR